MKNNEKDGHQESESTVCPRCKEEKPRTEFPIKGRGKNKERRYPYCKPCHGEYQRALRLMKFFNITVEEYDSILAAQGGVCAICERPPKNLSRRLCVDHDHSTGLVRGLLCSFCNRGIAIFRDDCKKLENAANFIKNPPAVRALGGARYGLKGRVTNKVATQRRLNKDLFERPKSDTEGKNASDV